MASPGSARTPGSEITNFPPTPEAVEAEPTPEHETAEQECPPSVEAARTHVAPEDNTTPTPAPESPTPVRASDNEATPASASIEAAPPLTPEHSTMPTPAPESNATPTPAPEEDDAFWAAAADAASSAEADTLELAVRRINAARAVAAAAPEPEPMAAEPTAAPQLIAGFSSPSRWAADGRADVEMATRAPPPPPYNTPSSEERHARLEPHLLRLRRRGDGRPRARARLPLKPKTKTREDPSPEISSYTYLNPCMRKPVLRVLYVLVFGDFVPSSKLALLLLWCFVVHRGLSHASMLAYI
jgi:hypothetical protein